MSAPLSTEDAARKVASSGIIGRTELESPAYGKPVCCMQRAVRVWATRYGPGRGVYLAARETNVRVTRQTCVGLGGFPISRPIACVCFLKEDVLRYPRAICAPLTQSQTYACVPYQILPSWIFFGYICTDAWM